MSTTQKRVLLLAATTLAALHSWASAGPLNPPAGAIVSTAKPLSEVEPRTAVNAANTPGTASSVYRITQPGSYYLTANVAGVAGKHGIDIAAAGVTLDLNGFDVVGVPAAGAFDGIRVSTGNVKGTVIRNGCVRNWGNHGVSIASIAGNTGQRIENITACNNGGSGIAGSGDTTSVINCTASENAGTGISGHHIQGCIARENNIGIVAIQGGSILSCVAIYNTGDGLFTGFTATVTDCTSCFNGEDGITCSNGSVISNCTLSGNTGSGADVFSSIVVRNCIALDNTLHGINTDSSCVIEGCLANSNTLDGIRCGSDSTVRNNTANSNGTGPETGAGVHATGNGARVEGNTCNNNEMGIDVDGGDNIVIRNTCSDNTEAFNIAANNFYGPIIDRRIPATIASTPAVAGFAAAGTMGSSDSNANFAH